MIDNIKNEIEVATSLAFRLLLDHKKTEEWLNTENTEFFGATPLEVIIRGHGIHLIEWLSERNNITFKPTGEPSKEQISKINKILQEEIDNTKDGEYKEILENIKHDVSTLNDFDTTKA